MEDKTFNQTCAERSEIVRIFNEARARAKRVKRVKRIEWVSLVVDKAVCSLSRDFHRENSRLHQGSLAWLAHLVEGCVEEEEHRGRGLGGSEIVMPIRKRVEFNR